MLQGRLTAIALATAASVVVLAACSGDGGGAIEDNVVRPGITAIDQSQSLACDGDRATLETAIQSYTLLNTDPPADEAALVAAQFLRAPSQNWNVVNGQIVAENPACGEVPTGTLPVSTIGEIVTDTAAPMSPDEVLASFSEEEVAAVGGIECATELAAILVAGDRYVAEQGVAPIDLQDLVAAGYLTTLPTLWTASGESLLPAAGSNCVDPSATDQATCEAQQNTLQVAREAYLAMNGTTATPSEQDLVDAGFLRTLIAGFDIVDGVVVPAAGDPCATTGG